MSPKPHVLIVDDDARIRDLLRDFLLANAYSVSLAASAKDAREKMQGLLFDAVVLDVMMPGETGLSFLESLRKGGDATPVIMLSALGEGVNRIAGLKAGSDDYLSKPFEPQELLLRLQNLLKRSAVAQEPVQEISFGEFTFELASGDLQRAGISLRLTTREKAILRLLAQNLGKGFSRLELAQAGSGESARSVDVQINRLRQKIEADPANPRYLQTVRGVGYTMYADFK